MTKVIYRYIIPKDKKDYFIQQVNNIINKSIFNYSFDFKEEDDKLNIALHISSINNIEYFLDCIFYSIKNIEYLSNIQDVK